MFGPIPGNVKSPCPRWRARAVRRDDAWDVASGLVEGRRAEPCSQAEVAKTVGILIDSGSLRGDIIESDGGIATLQIASFVPDEIATACLADGRRSFARSLLQRAQEAGAEFVFQRDEQIADAQAGARFALSILLWSCRTDEVPYTYARQLMFKSWQLFLRRYVGYRIERVALEVPQWQVERFLLAGFQPQTPILGAEGCVDDPSRLVRLALTREQACARWPGTFLDGLFSYAPPACGFSMAEQSVLSLAQDGLTDAEIAVALRTSANSVRMRWRSVYARMDSRAANVLEAASLGNGVGSRGTEKRRRVIEFIRQNQQELRPIKS